MNFASYISRRRRAYDALAYENILRRVCDVTHARAKSNDTLLIERLSHPPAFPVSSDVSLRDVREESNMRDIRNKYRSDTFQVAKLTIACF